MPRLLWKALTLVLAALLFGAAVYRAATLSVTVDEAYTYTQFVSQPFRAAAADYDANNHVLYTLLARASTAALGASDFSLRLPAIAAAALFFAALYRLTLQLAGPTWWLPLAFALTGANTLIGDLLPLARGYGLALALFTLGFSLLLENTTARWRLAGVALGLSMAANLTFLFPVSGLLAGAVWLNRRQGLASAAWAAGSAAILLAVPLWHATREHFYFGAASPLTSLGTLAGASLVRNLSERSGVVTAGMTIIAATLAAAVIAGTILRKRAPELFLVGSSIAASALLYAVGHSAAGLVFPHGRTGISWLLLFGIGTTALGARFRPVRLAAVPIVLAAFYCYRQAWSTAATIEWEWDAGTRAIAERIAREPHPQSGRPVRIAASAAMRHTLNYYRLTRGWTWLADVADVNIKEGTWDYYAVFGEDRQWLESQPGITVLYADPVAGSILARSRLP